MVRLLEPKLRTAELGNIFLKELYSHKFGSSETLCDFVSNSPNGVSRGKFFFFKKVKTFCIYDPKQPFGLNFTSFLLNRVKN